MYSLCRFLGLIFGEYFVNIFVVLFGLLCVYLVVCMIECVSVVVDGWLLCMRLLCVLIM